MNRREIILGLILALFLAIFISPFASQLPDGLEKVARQKGFFRKAQVKPLLSAPIPNYLWPGIKNEKIARAISGLAGILTVFTAMVLILKKAGRRR